ncbi:MAG: hypothetical protein ACLFMO_04405 [Eubacteriales bacterium]
MAEKISYVVKDKIGIIKEGDCSILESNYIEKYKKTTKEIHKKNEWKSMGSGAKFMNQISYVESEKAPRATINGIDFIKEAEVIYSVSVDNLSGILKKNIETGEESYIIHGSETNFYNLDYNAQINRAIVATQETYLERHIAILNIDNSYYQVITEGDTIEDNPVWSNRESSVLYYDSAGVGKDYEGKIMGFGPKVINKLNIDTGELEEVIGDAYYDCFLPKLDEEDNIYFLKKPYKEMNKHINPLKIFLIPFKILKAIYMWLNIFSMRYNGEPLNSNGNNPSKTKQVDEKEIIINGNLINAQKVFKENQSKGEKYPGIAPRSWQLVKMNKEGEFTIIKKGVLDFDVDKDGNIIYSNGKYIIKIDKSGQEEIIHKEELVTKIKSN